jgi:hypothetical protein
MVPGAARPLVAVPTDSNGAEPLLLADRVAGLTAAQLRRTGGGRFVRAAGWALASAVPDSRLVRFQKPASRVVSVVVDGGG